MSLLSAYLARKRQAMIARHVRGDVLDIGCQQGQLRERLAERMGRYAGIDRQVADIEATISYRDRQTSAFASL